MKKTLKKIFLSLLILPLIPIVLNFYCSVAEAQFGSGAFGAMRNFMRSVNVYFDNSRMGVGTSNPQKDIHISGTSGKALSIESTDTNGNRWDIISENDALGSLRFEIASTPIFVLRDDESVGFGTTTPDERFEIEWSANVDIELGNGASDTDITFIKMRNADGEVTYCYPHADQNAIICQSTKP